MANRIRQNHEGQHDGGHTGKDEEEGIPEIDPQAARDEVLRRAARINITAVDGWGGDRRRNFATCGT